MPQSSTPNYSLFSNPDLELALAGPGLGLSLALARPEQSRFPTMKNLADNEKAGGVHGPIPGDFLKLSSGWRSEQAAGEKVLLDGQASRRKGKEPLLGGHEPHKVVGDSHRGPLVIHNNAEPDRAPKKMKLNPDQGRVGEPGLMKLVSDFTTTIERLDGKKTKGFLYRFGGGQIGVVCNCHGWIIPVTDFVRHAAGNELMNPRKRVTVTVSVSPLL